MNVDLDATGAGSGVGAGAVNSSCAGALYSYEACCGAAPLAGAAALAGAGGAAVCASGLTFEGIFASAGLGPLTLSLDCLGGSLAAKMMSGRAFFCVSATGVFTTGVSATGVFATGVFATGVSVGFSLAGTRNGVNLLKDRGAVAAGDAPPATFMWDGAAMLAVRSAAQHDPALKPVLAQLGADAAQVASQGPWSVMDKPLTPASGDKHDYMSVGSYWWPCDALCNATLFPKPGECAAWNESDLGPKGPPFPNCSKQTGLPWYSPLSLSPSPDSLSATPPLSLSLCVSLCAGMTTTATTTR